MKSGWSTALSAGQRIFLCFYLKMTLPLCIVDYIMKFKGAYHCDKDERPYISELHMLKDVLPAHGVKASIVHLKEFYALKKAVVWYATHDYIPFGGLYADCMHLL